MLSCYALRLGACVHTETHDLHGLAWIILNPIAISGANGTAEDWRAVGELHRSWRPIFYHSSRCFARCSRMLGTLNLLCSDSSKASHIRETSWQLPISIRNQKGSQGTTVKIAGKCKDNPVCCKTTQGIMVLTYTMVKNFVDAFLWMICL